MRLAKILKYDGLEVGIRCKVKWKKKIDRRVRTVYI